MKKPAACVRPSICARSSTAVPVTPSIKSSPPWDKRLSITRICDSVVTSALWQATQLKTERTFLLAAFTLALLCSRSYTTAPCPSSAAPINCVQLFNLTSMYVRLRPLRAVADTSQGPQSEQPSKEPVRSAAAPIDPAAGASVASQPNLLHRSSDFESGLDLVSQPSFVRHSSDFESGLGLSTAHAGQGNCCYFLIVLEMLDQLSHLRLHAFQCSFSCLRALGWSTGR